MHKEFINNDLFNTYLVGGYVRDELLGKPAKDMDYVVEPKDGISIEVVNTYLLSIGFVGVGNDFPVYKKGEIDIALPRTERKVGIGYTGFETIVEGVTLIDDLLRRDLTINSIAYDVVNDKYIEPDGVSALQDLKDKKLRPTSKAFLEDPLRFIRLARMSAKMPDFEVVYDEFDHWLTDDIKNEIKSISQERIVMEIIKVLETDNPSNFFKVLKRLDILDIVLDDIDKMIGKEQSLIHHSEGDIFNHTMFVLDEISKITKDPMIKFGALLHDVGKAYTYEQTIKDGRDIKEAFYGHEDKDLVDSILKKYKEDLKFPIKYVDFASRASKMHHYIHNAESLNPKKLTKIMLDKTLIRNREELENLIMVAKADSYGRLSQQTKTKPETLSQEEILEAFEKGKIRKGYSLVLNGKTASTTNYDFFLDLYDFMEKHKEKFTITKELIMSGTLNDSNGNLDIPMKERYIYENALNVAKRFKETIQNKNIKSKKSFQP